MRIAIATLGCKVNQSESASIEGELRSRGYEVVDYKERPDLCIINTCTVTARSDQQSRQLIRRVVNQGAKVIATGCYAQLRPRELAEIKGVILVTGNSHKEQIINNINRLFTQGTPKIEISPPNTPVTVGPYHSNRVRAFLKIQDGCNLSCSYCTVPMARGRSRSLKPHDVLRAVGSFYSEGYREVVLTGVHIGSYGLDLNPKSSLHEIVEKITSTYPQLRLRLSSIEPQEFDKGLLSLIKDRLICPHLHIPLQSGSNKILRAMNRRYDITFFRELINKIISINPDISIGTDVIVGFPGEGDREFQETVALLEELPFSYIHVFPYSKRPNTPAESLSGHIEAETKRKRVGRVVEIGRKKKKAYISRYLGRSLDVIVEGIDRTTGFYRGISDNYIRAIIRKNGLNSGTRTSVKGVSLVKDNLICKPL